MQTHSFLLFLHVVLLLASIYYVHIHLSVQRRSRRTFSTNFEIFRRRVDDVVIYFLNSDFKFFDDALEFSVCFFSVLFLFSLKSSC